MSHLLTYLGTYPLTHSLRAHTGLNKGELWHGSVGSFDSTCLTLDYKGLQDGIQHQLTRATSILTVAFQENHDQPALLSFQPSMSSGREPHGISGTGFSLQAGCPSCHPTNSIKSTEWNLKHWSQAILKQTTDDSSRWTFTCDNLEKSAQVSSKSQVLRCKSHQINIGKFITLKTAMLVRIRVGVSDSILHLWCHYVQFIDKSLNT